MPKLISRSDMSSSSFLTRFSALSLACVSWVSVAAAQPAAEGPEYFAQNLLPILEKAQCRQCHNDNGIASGTRLQFPDPGANSQRVQAFALSLRSLVDPNQPRQSLLLRKPTQRIEHTGGQRIAPGSDDEAVLLAWIEHLAGLAHEPGFRTS